MRWRGQRNWLPEWKNFIDKRISVSIVLEFDEQNRTVADLMTFEDDEGHSNTTTLDPSKNGSGNNMSDNSTVGQNRAEAVWFAHKH